MSKAFLWFEFVLSIFFLNFGLFVAENTNPLMVAFWFVILIGSGYKLFLSGPKQ